MEKITTPFSDEAVANLNAWQQSGEIHPFTCGNPKCRAVLAATKDGWVCPIPGCGYTQNWAHDFMTKENQDASSE